MRTPTLFASFLKRPTAFWLSFWATAAVGFGAVLRLVQYSSNRSLWFDEVALILNLQERGYAELLKALDYNQAAPPLFLWIEKLALESLGNHEYAFRLFPLIGGLVSLLLFYQLTKRWASGWARPVALLLFAVQGYIVYFATETKPYSWDVAIGIALFMVTVSLGVIRPSWQQIALAAGLGATGIFLSFPSVLMMAGVEAANIVKLGLWRASWQTVAAFLQRRLVLYGTWIGSFLCLYFGTIRETLTETGLSDSWSGRYPGSWFDIVWVLDSLGRFFYRPLGFPSPADGVAIFVFITGLVYLYRAQRLRLLYLVSPLVANLGAAYLHKYPFRERLSLFLVPYGLVILAEGIVFWLSRWEKRPRLLGIVSAIVAVALLLMPLQRAIQDLLQPQRLFFDHVRPGLEYVSQQWQPGDKLYVLPGARMQFAYYQSRFRFPPADTVVSDLWEVGIKGLDSDDLEEYRQELAQLKQGPLFNQSRVWVVIARKRTNAEDTMVQLLGQLGKPLERKQYPGAMVGLYDFSGS